MPALSRRFTKAPVLRRAGAWTFAFFLAKGLAWLALAAAIGYAQS